IAVYAEDAASGGVQQRARIAAAAEGAVDVMGAIARIDNPHDFGKQNGNVAGHLWPPLRKAAARLMSSLCWTAKRLASQIWNLRPMPTKVTRSSSAACWMNS